jgi:hypothetical membrane protein
MTARLAACLGLAGVLMVVLLSIIGGMYFPGYRHASQFISELGAIDAPHGKLISFAGFLPAGLLIASFSFLAWRILPRSPIASIAFLCLFFYAFGYIGAAFFPCEEACRPETPGVSQALHNLFGLAGYVLAAPMLLLFGLAARKWPKAGALPPVAFSACPVALLGMLLMSPDFEFVGLAQRALEGSVLVWVIVCCLYLLRSDYREQAYETNATTKGRLL